MEKPISFDLGFFCIFYFVTSGLRPPPQGKICFCSPLREMPERQRVNKTINFARAGLKSLLAEQSKAYSIKF